MNIEENKHYKNIITIMQFLRIWGGLERLELIEAAIMIYKAVLEEEEKLEFCHREAPCFFKEGELDEKSDEV